MLLLLIPIVWLGVATLVVCLCRMAAMADSAKGPKAPRGAVRAQLLVLEPASRRARSAPRSALSPRGFATIHSIR
jgi:hypothetical protein